jgi:hypothetical protein
MTSNHCHLEEQSKTASLWYETQNTFDADCFMQPPQRLREVAVFPLRNLARFQTMASHRSFGASPGLAVGTEHAGLNSSRVVHNISSTCG